MPMNIWEANGVVVLSNFARLMNDPRHFDAGRDLREYLDRGDRAFVLDLTGLRDLGSSVLGLLTTLTRQIRTEGGEAVLANVSPATEKSLDEMRMDIYWDVFPSIDEAAASFAPAGGKPGTEPAGGK
jgi:anti-anti-sigma factor